MVTKDHPVVTKDRPRFTFRCMFVGYYVMSALFSGLYNFDSGLFTARMLCSAMCDTDSNTDTGQRRRLHMI